MRSAARRLLDLLAPPQCPVTGEAVAAPGHLAAHAWSALHFIEDPACARCGAPFAHEIGDGACCAACLSAPPDFDSARAAVVYDDASHRLIVSFKHTDRLDLAPMLASWLIRAGRGLVTPQSIVAPTPLHRRRLFARRYNQSAVLAAAVAKAAGARYEPLLLARTRPTPPQTRLSAEARRRNLAGAIAVRGARAALLAGAHVVIIDDVLTTGATLSACARAVRRAGARRVDALVVARALKGGGLG
jgi:ComF family protein